MSLQSVWFVSVDDIDVRALTSSFKILNLYYVEFESFSTLLGILLLTPCQFCLENTVRWLRSQNLGHKMAKGCITLKVLCRADGRRKNVADHENPLDRMYSNTVRIAH